MSSKLRLPNWNNWTIRKQIYYAMGSVVVLVMAIAVVSVVLTKQTGGIFFDYRKAAQQSLVASELSEDLSHVFIRAYEHRLTGRDQSYEATLQSITEVIEHGEELSEEYKDRPELVSLFQAMIDAIETFQSNFESAALLQGRRAHVANETSELVSEAIESLDAITGRSLASGGIAVSYTASLAQQSILKGQVELERYLRSHDETDFQRAIDHIDSALKKSGELVDMLVDPTAIDLARTTQGQLISLRSRTNNVLQTIQRNDGFHAEMAAAGPRAETALNDFLADVTDRQNTLGPAGSATVRTALTSVELLGIFAVMFAIFLAWRIGKVLSANVTRSVETMSALANGDLEVEINGEERENELGQMARALVVFRDNAVEARRLEAEKQAADARERKLQAEKAERDRARAEEARERSEEESRKLAEAAAFQEAVEAVIARAGDGDFSARVSTDDNGNESFRQLANAINTLIENVETGLSETARVVRLMAEGDLTGHMSGTFRGAFAKLQTDVNQTLISMNALIGDLSDRGHSVSEKSTELKSAASQMSRRSEQNAASLEETSAALEEMSTGVRQVAGNVSRANQDAQTAAEAAQAGAAVSREAVKALSEITEASRKMESIAGIIEDIAFQINLLALNAGVESARAGEAGRGFAVVASEVRSLAQRSTESVAEISQVIAVARDKVQTGVENVGKTQQTLDSIVDAVNRVSERMSSVATSMDQQSTGIAEINTAVTTLDASTQANASASEEVTAASSMLQEDAQGLSKTLSTFRTAANAGPEINRANDMPFDPSLAVA